MPVDARISSFSYYASTRFYAWRFR